MTKEEKIYLDDLITKAMTVDTDEIEGQQTINLNDINLCAVDYSKSDITSDYDDFMNIDGITDQSILQKMYDDKDLWKLIITPPEEVPDILSDIDTSTRVIIEFSDATVKDPNPVEYSLNIKPGDTIDNNTIIGSVMQEGKMKPIKSIFEKGHVMSKNDDTEFFRLYPSKCDRHIVLDNTLIGLNEDYNVVNDVSEINAEFSKEGSLYALITNNLCQSLLPCVLARRYRGTYTRTKTRVYTTDSLGHWEYGNWYLNSSDASYDTLGLDTSLIVDSSLYKEYKDNAKYDTSLFVFDITNEKLNTGVTIYDTSIMMNLHESQDVFGSSIIAEDVTKADMKSWRKRAKKKRKRKKVKKEIKDKAYRQTNRIKNSDNPYEAIQKEGKRLLDARTKYVDDIIKLYKSLDTLPLCKYDPNYTDCKFLVNNNIDGKTYTEANRYDDEFSYIPIGDSDHYQNYYYSLLGNINLLSGSTDTYSQEYYNLITDIINKRLVVESRHSEDLMYDFMDLFNKNVKQLFNIYVKNLTNDIIKREFNKLKPLIATYVQNENKSYKESIRKQFTVYNKEKYGQELDEEAIQNAGEKYTGDNEYKQIYDYISSLYSYDSDEDTDTPNEICSQLATMYTYIKSYGDGSSNPYKDIKDKNEPYIYLKLIQEESKKIREFWDKVLKEYEDCSYDKCYNSLINLSEKMDEYAQWPTPQDITIDNIYYQHYLFENIYPSDLDSSINDISIGDYNFPDEVDFPEIPDDVSVDENWAIDEMNKHEQLPPDDINAITFKDFPYWKKYFALATLICIVPTFWNCGLDIFPFIQCIPLPCIFIAIKSIYIPMFNMIMVFGIAIRGMYPWPIILYVNTSDQPISILTPLIAILDRLKNVFYGKLDKIEQVPIQSLANAYIAKLNKEINDLKKENIKLDNFKTVIKSLNVPKAESIKRQFASIVDPSIDMRQRLTRLETLSRKSKANYMAK